MTIQNSPLKILCVDDEEVHINLLSRALEEHFNVTIVSAYDGLLAFKKARNQKFDLIITDYRMPRLDGNDLITALRETDMNLHTPILIHTGFADNILRELNTSYKLIDLVEKPCDEDELHKTVENLLNGKSNIGRFDIEKKKPKTDLNFLNSFIDATLYTLEQMTSLSGLEHKKPYVLEDQDLGVSISANITMTSALFSGILGIGFKEELYLKVVSDLFDSPQESIMEENRDAAGELINIIYGQTKLRLSELGFKLGKAIPSIVVGKNHQVYADSSLKTLVVPFRSDFGDFYIFISLKSGI